jgi:hypothetical protein
MNAPATRTCTFTLHLPVSEDEMGLWMESNGARLSLSCSLGMYCASIDMKHLVSYSDDEGEYCEKWSLSQYDKDVSKAIAGVFVAAQAIRAKAEEKRAAAKRIVAALGAATPTKVSP